MNNYGANAVAPAGVQPVKEQNLNNFNNDTLTGSEKLLARLRDLRGRLVGEGLTDKNSIAPECPPGIISMAATIHSNVVVAHKIVDELETLIG